MATYSEVALLAVVLTCLNFVSWKPHKLPWKGFQVHYPFGIHFRSSDDLPPATNLDACSIEDAASLLMLPGPWVPRKKFAAKTPQQENNVEPDPHKTHHYHVSSKARWDEYVKDTCDEFHDLDDYFDPDFDDFEEPSDFQHIPHESDPQSEKGLKIETEYPGLRDKIKDIEDSLAEGEYTLQNADSNADQSDQRASKVSCQRRRKLGKSDRNESVVKRIFWFFIYVLEVGAAGILIVVVVKATICSWLGCLIKFRFSSMKNIDVTKCFGYLKKMQDRATSKGRKNSGSRKDIQEGSQHSLSSFSKISVQDSTTNSQLSVSEMWMRVNLLETMLKRYENMLNRAENMVGIYNDLHHSWCGNNTFGPGMEILQSRMVLKRGGSLDSALAVQNFKPSSSVLAQALNAKIRCNAEEQGFCYLYHNEKHFGNDSGTCSALSTSNACASAEASHNSLDFKNGNRNTKDMTVIDEGKFSAQLQGREYFPIGDNLALQLPPSTIHVTFPELLRFDDTRIRNTSTCTNHEVPFKGKSVLSSRMGIIDTDSSTWTLRRSQPVLMSQRPQKVINIDETRSFASESVEVSSTRWKEIKEWQLMQAGKSAINVRETTEMASVVDQVFNIYFGGSECEDSVSNLSGRPSEIGGKCCDALSVSKIACKACISSKKALNVPGNFPPRGVQESNIFERDAQVQEKALSISLCHQKYSQNAVHKTRNYDVDQHVVKNNKSMSCIARNIYYSSNIVDNHPDEISNSAKIKEVLQRNNESLGLQKRSWSEINVCKWNSLPVATDHLNSTFLPSAKDNDDNDRVTKENTSIIVKPDVNCSKIGGLTPQQISSSSNLRLKIKLKQNVNVIQHHQIQNTKQCSVTKSNNKFPSSISSEHIVVSDVGVDISSVKDQLDEGLAKQMSQDSFISSTSIQEENAGELEIQHRANVNEEKIHITTGYRELVNVNEIKEEELTNFDLDVDKVYRKWFDLSDNEKSNELPCKVELLCNYHPEREGSFQKSISAMIEHDLRRQYPKVLSLVQENKAEVIENHVDLPQDEQDNTSIEPNVNNGSHDGKENKDDTLIKHIPEEEQLHEIDSSNAKESNVDPDLSTTETKRDFQERRCSRVTENIDSIPSHGEKLKKAVYPRSYNVKKKEPIYRPFTREREEWRRAKEKDKKLPDMFHMERGKIKTSCEACGSSSKSPREKSTYNTQKRTSPAVPQAESQIQQNKTYQAKPERDNSFEIARTVSHLSRKNSSKETGATSNYVVQQEARKISKFSYGKKETATRSPSSRVLKNSSSSNTSPSRIPKSASPSKSSKVNILTKSPTTNTSPTRKLGNLSLDKLVKKASPERPDSRSPCRTLTRASQSTIATTGSIISNSTNKKKKSKRTTTDSSSQTPGHRVEDNDSRDMEYDDEGFDYLYTTRSQPYKFSKFVHYPTAVEGSERDECLQYVPWECYDPLCAPTEWCTDPNCCQECDLCDCAYYCVEERNSKEYCNIARPKIPLWNSDPKSVPSADYKPVLHPIPEETELKTRAGEGDQVSRSAFIRERGKAITNLSSGVQSLKEQFARCKSEGEQLEVISREEAEMLQARIEKLGNRVKSKLGDILQAEAELMQWNQNISDASLSSKPSTTQQSSLLHE